jgi:hypothetical protein
VVLDPVPVIGSVLKVSVIISVVDVKWVLLCDIVEPSSQPYRLVQEYVELSVISVVINVAEDSVVAVGRADEIWLELSVVPGKVGVCRVMLAVPVEVDSHS